MQVHKVEDEGNEILHFKHILKGCQDVVFYDLEILDKEGAKIPVSLIYCFAMVDTDNLRQAFLPKLLKEGADLLENVEGNSKECGNFMLKVIPLESEKSQIFQALFSGNVILLIKGYNYAYVCDLSKLPMRQPEESTMEVSLKGPRDGFVEDLWTNITLIRRRLKTPDLQCETLVLGRESQTTVTFMYVGSMADHNVIDKARKNLQAIDVVTVDSSTQIESLMSSRKVTLVPLVEHTGRPDYAAAALMTGRFAVVVDGNPSVIMGPADLALLIKSPEDLHMPFFFVTLERLLRFIGLFISVFAPSFWVALCAFHPDQIPFTLLATVTISRIGLPLSTTMEMFLMLGMFELFREAGIRLPKAVGQTVTVVGGLIVGDAAISAGLTSPTMLVVAAVSAVASFTLVNQVLNGSVSILRIYMLVFSAVLGMLGFFLGLFSIIVYLCSLESYGQSYMAPLSTMQFRLWPKSFIQLPWGKRRGKKERYNE
ncbi:hypothetical protein J2Z69_001327 [Paenibacillus shirakamiensis]|uniref:Spore germination protein n=1 Tax=Paenibacillus shirakamiensis TaxID=1265935 RepID=A0ABS4JF35_9BACL|nr:hypothetical protein [Paenibacillus shirakamiensis]